MKTSNASNRLDRLPISRYHKITLIGVAFAYFFEFADINTFAVTAQQQQQLLVKNPMRLYWPGEDA